MGLEGRIWVSRSCDVALVTTYLLVESTQIVLDLILRRSHGLRVVDWSWWMVRKYKFLSSVAVVVISVAQNSWSDQNREARRELK